MFCPRLDLVGAAAFLSIVLQRGSRFLGINTFSRARRTATGLEGRDDAKEKEDIPTIAP